MTVWLVVAIAAAAETTATVDVVIGVTGNPEATLEQPTGTPARALEPEGTAAILLGARRSWKGGPWLALSGEAWTYAPEPEPTLLRATPQAGVALDGGKSGHVDLAARYAFEAVPLRAPGNSGRAEGTVTAGMSTGAHTLDLVGTGVDRTWFGQPSWSFRAAEGGATWAWQPSDWRVGARATAQANAGSTLASGAELAPTTGYQLRLGASSGYTHGPIDVSLEYRLYVAFEGQVAGPMVQFQPVFVRLEAAGALALQGQADVALGQHRLFEPLDFKVIGQRTADVNQLIQGVHVEIRHGEFAFEVQGFFLQMTQVEKQWHNSFQVFGFLDGAAVRPSFRCNAVTTCGGTNVPTSPPRRAISFTMRELRNV